MPVGLQAIIPKHIASISTANVLRDLPAVTRRYLLDVAKQMGQYPPQEPTDYVRTGDLGRGWTAPGSVNVKADGGTLVNRTGYAVYVQGPNPGAGKGKRQARVMRRKHWKSITDVARPTIKKYKPLYNKAIRGRP